MFLFLSQEFERFREEFEKFKARFDARDDTIDKTVPSISRPMEILVAIRRRFDDWALNNPGVHCPFCGCIAQHVELCPMTEATRLVEAAEGVGNKLMPEGQQDGTPKVEVPSRACNEPEHYSSAYVMAVTPEASQD